MRNIYKTGLRLFYNGRSNHTINDLPCDIFLNDHDIRISATNLYTMIFLFISKKKRKEKKRNYPLKAIMRGISSHTNFRLPIAILLFLITANKRMF